VDFNKALFGRLRFSPNAAHAIFYEQGIDEMAEFKILTDKQIENICKVIHRPGGMIPNPAVIDMAAPPAGVPLNILNPDIPICAIAEREFKMNVYCIKHLEMTCRTPQYANVTL